MLPTHTPLCRQLYIEGLNIFQNPNNLFWHQYIVSSACETYCKHFEYEIDKLNSGACCAACRASLPSPLIQCYNIYRRRLGLSVCKRGVVTMCRRLTCDGDDDDDVVDDLKITTDKILRLCENIELFDLLMLLSRNYTMCSWPTVYGVAFFLLSHIVILQKKKVENTRISPNRSPSKRKSDGFTFRQSRAFNQHIRIIRRWL